MGTTRIKVIDLSSDQKEIKTSRKHARLAESKRAEKLSGIEKLKKAAGPEGTLARREAKEQKPETSPHQAEQAEITETTEVPSPSIPSVSPSVPSVTPSVSSAVARKHTRGKKYQQAKSQIEPDKTYSAADAIKLLNKTSWTKFDPTVEIHLNIADKNIKGSVNLPHPVGKQKQKVTLIFTDKKIAETKNILIGNLKTIDDIQAGKLRAARDFDAVIAEPKFMTHLVKIAKILGPRGMMPNPKDKTITENPQSAIEKQDNSPGSYEYKTDPTAPIIHLVLGKLSLKPDELEKNLKTFVSAIGPTKIERATIKSTMSPGIKIDISSLAS